MNNLVHADPIIVVDGAPEIVERPVEVMRAAPMVAPRAAPRVKAAPVPVPLPVAMPMALPVAMPMALPADLVEEIDDEDDDELKITARFWNIISKLNWRNRSDQVMDLHRTANAINSLRGADRNAFNIMYKRVYALLFDAINEPGIFRTMDTPRKLWSVVISHIIAMGQGMFDVVISEPTFIEFIISMSEMQDFHSCVPEDMRE